VLIVSAVCSSDCEFIFVPSKNKHPTQALARVGSREQPGILNQALPWK